METKDWITLFGVIATLVVSSTNLILTHLNKKKGDYISSINNERRQWLNSIRKAFSEFNKLGYSLAMKKRRVNDILDDEKWEDIIFQGNHIELFLNPNEKVVKLFLEHRDSMLHLLMSRGNFDFNSYSMLAEKVAYLQQIILKSEWKIIKMEIQKGKELNDVDKEETVLKIAKSISLNIYEELQCLN